MARREADIDGWWVAIDAELGGFSLPTEALSDLPLRLQKGTFRLGTDEGRTVFNGHVHPLSLDLILTRGPNRGRIVPAIYDLNVDGLRLCCDLSGAHRPETFTAPAGTRRFLVSYRRPWKPSSYLSLQETRSDSICPAMPSGSCRCELSGGSWNSWPR